jgi:hypothetical protein
MTKNTFSPKQSASVQGSAKPKFHNSPHFFTFVVMSFCNTHNTVSILQWIMLIRVRSLPAEDFVPARVLRAVQVSGRLVDRVADADATVRVHPREPVVLRQLGLSNGNFESPEHCLIRALVSRWSSITHWYKVRLVPGGRGVSRRCGRFYAEEIAR